MQTYTINYLDSQGDDYNIDSFEESFIKLKIENESQLQFILTIRFPTDIDHNHRIEITDEQTPTAWNLTTVANALKTIEDESETQGCEFYSSIFYDDETDDFTKTLTFQA